MKIGIIGLGAVGSAIYKILNVFHEDVKGFDINTAVSKDSLDDVLKTDNIYLALPTNSDNNNRLDTSLLINYLEKLRSVNYKGLVILKSTLPLCFLKDARTFGLRVLYSPEFLHEKTALFEMLNPSFIVVSGSDQDILAYKKILYWLPGKRFYPTDDRTAEMIKLAMNAFAATKISFVNEIERICKIYNADVQKVMEILRFDKRCAAEYSYPNRGPYGGKCLVKDIRELLHSDPNPVLFDAVEKVNERTKMKSY